MKKRYVFTSKVFPSRIPLMPTITAWIALEHWQAPGWIWGVVGTLYVIVWASYVASFWCEETVDPLGSDPDKPEQVSKWRQRIEELQQKQRDQRTS